MRSAIHRIAFGLAVIFASAASAQDTIKIGLVNEATGPNAELRDGH